MDLHYLVSDLQRRVANMVRRGRVHSVDLQAQPPRCRVEFQENVVSGWLPWVSGRAGTRKDWEPLTVGERVLVVSESGELANGVVISGLNNTDYSVPSTSPDEHVTRYEDGTQITYDRAVHKLTISVGGDGDAQLDCKTFHINADIEHNGKQHSTGNIQSDQNIAAAQNISDGIRSMSADRQIYNDHDHNHDSDTTSKPNQGQ
ncbi:MAG: phage baseplate assembly protein V [Pontibacterium sp.]